MSSSILHIKPEEIDTAEKRGKYTVSIVGCGEVGVLHALLFAEAGFKVVCTDTNQSVVNNLAKGKTPFLKREIELKLKNYRKTGQLDFISDVKAAVSQSSIVVVAVSVKVDKKKKPDYSEMENVCKRIGLGLRRGSLVIVVSTTGIGVTEGLVKETLENTSGFQTGVDIGLAYSPIRALNNQTLENLASCRRIVAAVNTESLNVASVILSTIAKNGVEKVDNFRTAEVATLFESSRLDANVALANELALFCEKAGVDYLEVCRLANISSDSAVSMPKLTQEDTQAEPYLLLEDAENLNLKLRIPAIAREVNEETIRHAVNLTKDALRNCGKTLRRAKVSLLGISKLPNTKSFPQKTAKALAEALEAKGAKVSLYDPYFSGEELGEIRKPLNKNLTDAVEGKDCIIILTGHDQFKRLNLKKLKVVMKMPAAIVDFEGVMEPDKVEKEGIIYRGLGRGVWTK
jgi:UDP-N-acetyl-D-mannosaminuronic acid dehydrogenase